MYFQYIYILQCNRNGESTFYTGMTTNPKRRFRQHKNCQSKYTKRFNGNIYMVYLEELSHRDKKIVGSMAWKREKQVKKYSTNRKKQLIRLNQQKTARLIRIHLG